MKKLFALAVLAGLSMGAHAQTVQRGGKMVFARYDDSALIDPIYAERNPDIWMVLNLYDTLLRTETDGKTISPGLAEAYAVAPDGLSIKLTLRQGIHFSNGADITAEDVIFSLARAGNPDLGPWASLLGAVEAVTAEGREITLKLRKPDPALISVLGTFSTAIVPKAAFEAAPGSKDKEKSAAFFAAGPVGSGPFVMTARKQGSRTVFARNPHYWRKGEDGKALPYLDEVELLTIPDDATRILKLQAGEVDVAEMIPFSRVSELRSSGKLTVKLFPATRIVYAPINAREKFADGSPNPMADLRVRQALNYATDKDALIKLITFGIGKPMTSMMPSATQLHVGPAPLYPYDLAKAKALLAEAGIKPGTRIKLTTLAGGADDATLFTALQQMWKAAGLDLVVEQVDGPTRGAKNRSGDFQIHTYGWVNDINDPAQVVGWLGYFKQRQAVGTGWNSPEFNKLFEDSNVEINPAKRAAQYRTMQEIYAREAPLLFLYETPFAVAHNLAIKGYTQSPLGANEFATAWRER